MITIRKEAKFIMSEISNTFVTLLGIGTVFVGLICIVFLCMAMSGIVRYFQKDKAVTPAAPVPSAPAQPIADRQAIIAASCALIAEELGADVKNIKVVSFKKM